MQVVRADGFERLEPLERAVPLPAEGSPTLSEAPEHPLVVVEWHDAWFDFDLAGPEDARPDYLVRTVGFLVADGPRFVSLAQEVLPDGDGFRAVTHIPLPIVERLVYLDPATGLATA
jgi:hypothetical protein